MTAADHGADSQQEYRTPCSPLMARISALVHPAASPKAKVAAPMSRPRPSTPPRAREPSSPRSPRVNTCRHQNGAAA